MFTFVIMIIYDWINWIIELLYWRSVLSCIHFGCCIRSDRLRMFVVWNYNNRYLLKVCEACISSISIALENLGNFWLYVIRITIMVSLNICKCLTYIALCCFLGSSCFLGTYLHLCTVWFFRFLMPLYTFSSFFMHLETSFCCNFLIIRFARKLYCS